MIREDGVIMPVEIKSASTFAVDFLKGWEHFRSLGAGHVSEGVVLYNGEQSFNVRGGGSLTHCL